MVARSKSEKMVNPEVAWPTLALFGVCLIVEVGLASGALLGAVPLWAASIGLVVASYALFTPMHDSAHGSIGRAKWLNALVGRVCALVLMAPYPGFRYAHLRHHKKTNDVHEDPDMWSGGGRAWTRPLRWLTQDLHYYTCYIRAWRGRSIIERLELVGTLVAVAAGLGTLIALGYGWEALFLWVLPAKLAIAALAFFFDYLPHRPHTVTAAEDRYKATSNIGGRWLTPLMLYQNYHLVHHLYPGVPFYRYARVWRARREKLQARGAMTRPLWGGLGR